MSEGERVRDTRDHTRNGTVVRQHSDDTIIVKWDDEAYWFAMPAMFVERVPAEEGAKP